VINLVVSKYCKEYCKENAKPLIVIFLIIFSRIAPGGVAGSPRRADISVNPLTVPQIKGSHGILNSRVSGQF
jgi:hypothetical protein